MVRPIGFIASRTPTSENAAARPLNFHEAVRLCKKQILADALIDHGGNRTRTARALGLQRTYLLRLIRQLAIQVPRSDTDNVTRRLGSMRYRLHCATWYVVRENGTPSPRILSAPDAAAALGIDLATAADDDKEHMWAVLLNSQNHYLMHTEVSMGTQSASLVHPREVVGPALREGASAIILLHNHPSGDCTPSREDVRLTRQLIEATNLLDLRLHDHVIVGSGTWTWVSMAQQGLL